MKGRDSKGESVEECWFLQRVVYLLEGVCLGGGDVVRIKGSDAEHHPFKINQGSKKKRHRLGLMLGGRGVGGNRIEKKKRESLKKGKVFKRSKGSGSHEGGKRNF